MCSRGLAAKALLLTLLMHSLPSFAQQERALAATLSEQRLLFGHQSVGANLLSGVSALKIPNLRLQEVTKLDELSGPGFAHVRIGRNEDPLSKLTHFESLFEKAQGAPYQLAFFKFCYIDFNATTDVDALFQRYVQTFERLSAAHPQTRFVHLTVPLTTVQSGLKAQLKSWLGRARWGAAENRQRHRFNEKLRAHYGNGKAALFDLAALEARHPDGRIEQFELDGQSYPQLIAAYSDDGQHLLLPAAEKLARTLLTTLEAELRRTP